MPLALGLRMDATATDAAAASAAKKEPMLFTQEMRNKAMSLHTFSQAPKSGGQQRDTSANTVVDQWETTR
jgi:hypothetical protein